MFLGVLRCFTSPRSLVPPYVFRRPSAGITRRGFPHSEISGSKRVCRSPKLIAAYYVLHRLPTPRHSPCALTSLTKIGHIFLPNHRFGELVFFPNSYAVVKEPPAEAGNCFHMALVGVPGVEPGTSSLSGTRSNQLSYTPDANEGWWRQPGSNR
jgi:hypothetical protein